MKRLDSRLRGNDRKGHFLTFYEAVKLDSAPRSANIMPMIRHFDHLARIYDHFAGRPNLTVLRDLLGLPIQGWMLDEGGGTGRVSYPFLSEVGGIVVVDASFPMLRAARSKGRLLAVKSLAEGLPFSDKCIERILVVDAFHHFHDAARSIGELSRVLKQGGRLVIEEPDLRRQNPFGQCHETRHYSFGPFWKIFVSLLRGPGFFDISLISDKA